jgi:hypothetical protein
VIFYINHLLKKIYSFLSHLKECYIFVFLLPENGIIVQSNYVLAGKANVHATPLQ